MDSVVCQYPVVNTATTTATWIQYSVTILLLTQPCSLPRGCKFSRYLILNPSTDSWKHLRKNDQLLIIFYSFFIPASVARHCGKDVDEKAHTYTNTKTIKTNTNTQTNIKTNTKTNIKTNTYTNTKTNTYTNVRALRKK